MTACMGKKKMRDLYIRSMSLMEPVPRENYLADLPAVKYLSAKGIEFHQQVTFFVGENGSGKSTLIEALAISQGFNPEGGTKNFCFSTENSHSELCDYLRVARGFLYPQDGFFHNWKGKQKAKPELLPEQQQMPAMRSIILYETYP